MPDLFVRAAFLLIVVLAIVALVAIVIHRLNSREISELTSDTAKKMDAAFSDFDTKMQRKKEYTKKLSNRFGKN